MKKKTLKSEDSLKDLIPAQSHHSLACLVYWRRTLLVTACESRDWRATGQARRTLGRARAAWWGSPRPGCSLGTGCSSGPARVWVRRLTAGGPAGGQREYSRGRRWRILSKREKENHSRLKAHSDRRWAHRRRRHNQNSEVIQWAFRQKSTTI